MRKKPTPSAPPHKLVFSVSLSMPQVHQRWPVVRKLITEAARPWWEYHMGFHEPKPRCGTYRARCDRLIKRIVATLGKDSDGHPLYNGHRLRQADLIELMCKEDETVSSETYKRYVRHWFIRQKLATPLLLTKKDLAFLEQEDPPLGIKALQTLLRLRHPSIQ